MQLANQASQLTLTWCSLRLSGIARPLTNHHPPLFHIWSLLAPKNKDGDGQNPNSRLQTAVHKPRGDVTTAMSIIYTVYDLHHTST